MTPPRFLPKTVWDLERLAGVERTQPPAHTQADITRLTRKRLGPAWGRKRRPRQIP